MTDKVMEGNGSDDLFADSCVAPASPTSMPSISSEALVAEFRRRLSAGQDVEILATRDEGSKSTRIQRSPLRLSPGRSRQRRTARSTGPSTCTLPSTAVFEFGMSSTNEEGKTAPLTASRVTSEVKTNPQSKPPFWKSPSGEKRTSKALEKLVSPSASTSAKRLLNDSLSGDDLSPTSDAEDEKKCTVSVVSFAGEKMSFSL